jgi:hypothetical protein
VDGAWLDTVAKLSQIGSTGLLLTALFGAYKGWWVPGRTYEDAVKRELSWRELYDREKAKTDARLASLEEERRDRERRP